MKKFLTSYGMILFLVLLGMAIIAWKSGDPRNEMTHTYPNLPAPIGEEKILLTVAGQPAEGRIIQKLAEQLHLNSDYRPRALSSDIYDYSTIIIAIGYDPIGIKYTGRSLEEEKQRLIDILNESDKNHIPIILIYLDGAGRQSQQSLEYISLAAPFTSYFLGLKSMSQQSFIKELSEKNKFPVTLVRSLKDLAKPLNSAFR